MRKISGTIAAFLLMGVPVSACAWAQESADPCRSAEVAATPTRPTWSTSTATTQCGVVDVDGGWILQPMAPDVRQQVIVSSVRYGLTPKLDLRFGMTNFIAQYGSATPSLHGAGDQWLSARYRFSEPAQSFVSLAFSYGYKFATASPGNGFGSGYGDHALTLIASHDFGKTHFDWNGVGTIAGGAHGCDGSAQFDLTLARLFAKKFTAAIESYGGSQPGTSDRYGAGSVGFSYAVTPRLVLDAAYARAYTAGAPRSQIAFGFTAAHRVPLPLLPRTNRVARWIGR